MLKKTYFKIFFTAILLIVIPFTLSKFIQKKLNPKKDFIQKENLILEDDSNLIKDVKYNAKDSDGNQYIVKAKEGKTNQLNKNIIFLRYIEAKIILTDGSHINIYSNYAEYNILNYNTIFNENVIVDYLNNKITGDYLEFSLEKNLIFMKNNIIFKNSDSILKADAIEINTKSKNTKIYMYNSDKKINIQKFN